MLTSADMKAGRTGSRASASGSPTVRESQGKGEGKQEVSGFMTIS